MFIFFDKFSLFSEPSEKSTVFVFFNFYGIRSNRDLEKSISSGLFIPSVMGNVDAAFEPTQKYTPPCRGDMNRAAC
jgi:hypothetical protein